MTTDTYTKVVLTAIALFLGAIAVKPAFSPETVQAALQTTQKQSSAAAAASAPAAPVSYQYAMYFGGGIAESKDKDFNKLNEYGSTGWELVAAVPMQNQRLDNLAMGTAQIMYIFRQRK